MKIDKVLFTKSSQHVTTLKDGIVRHATRFKALSMSKMDTESLNINSKSITAYKDPSEGRFVDISASDYHILMLNDKGEVFGVGESKYGRMSGSKPETYTTPHKLKIPGDEKVTKVHALKNNSFILTEEGNAYGVGANNEGQLGLPRGSERAKWIRINPEGVKFTDLTRDERAQNSTKFYAKTDKGEFYSWGSYSKPFKVSFPQEIHDNIEKMIPREQATYGLSANHIYCFRTTNSPGHTLSFTLDVKNPTNVINMQSTAGGVFIDEKDDIKLWTGAHNPKNVNPPDFNVGAYINMLAPPGVDKLPSRIVGECAYDSKRVYTNRTFMQVGDGVYAFKKEIGESDRAAPQWKYDFAGTLQILNASESTVLEQPQEFVAAIVDAKCSGVASSGKAPF